MAVSYTAEEVERVILALYSGQNVAEANTWLTQYVATPVGGLHRERTEPLHPRVLGFVMRWEWGSSRWQVPARSHAPPFCECVSPLLKAPLRGFFCSLISDASLCSFLTTRGHSLCSLPGRFLST